MYSLYEGHSGYFSVAVGGARINNKNTINEGKTEARSSGRGFLVEFALVGVYEVVWPSR